jgi:hypothetical protein
MCDQQSIVDPVWRLGNDLNRNRARGVTKTGLAARGRKATITMSEEEFSPRSDSAADAGRRLRLGSPSLLTVALGRAIDKVRRSDKTGAYS